MAEISKWIWSKPEVIGKYQHKDITYMLFKKKKKSWFSGTLYKLYFVLENNGKCVARGGYRLSERNEKRRITNEEVIRVNKAYRRNGLSKIFLLEIMKFAIAHNVNEIQIDIYSEELKKWFETVGFKFQREFQVQLDPELTREGIVTLSWRMCKKIDSHNLEEFRKNLHIQGKFTFI